MKRESKKSDTRTLRAAVATEDTGVFKDAVHRMFLTKEPAEIVRMLSEAARSRTGAASAVVFLYDADRRSLSGDDPSLLPEQAVLDFVFEESNPPTIPHADGRFITVFPLRVQQNRIGVLVLDVTGRAEEVARMSLEPVTVLADQAAVALENARAVSRSIGESTLLQNILDSITNGIATLDAERRITRLNQNAMAMLQISAEAMGRPYADVFPPEVTGAVDDMIHEMQEAGFAMEKMLSVKFGQGLELNIAVSTSTLRDANYAPLGTIVVFRDMTASRELDRLRKLDTMKSEFVANVSHELKTPLTSIKAYTEALLEMASEDQMKAFLKVIEEESDRLLYLINDLLNVSRIQSGKIKMNFERTKPRMVYDEVTKISKVHSEKHEIIAEIAGDLPEMLLDKEKLKEVMINLISNAIKYSPEGGKVWIRMRKDENNLRIEIQDQGMGISKENQQKLFQAFFRVDSSLTAEIPGTGLGLVIVKAIVEHHGGRVWMESEPGRGTTFFILIPIRQEIKRGEAGSDLGSMA